MFAFGQTTYQVTAALNIQKMKKWIIKKKINRHKQDVHKITIFYSIHFSIYFRREI